MPADRDADGPAGKPPDKAVDELITEERGHLAKAEAKAASQGATGADQDARQHAEDQVGRAEGIKMEAVVVAQGSEFKTYLLSMATHDIKTPLTALALQVETMTAWPGCWRTSWSWRGSGPGNSTSPTRRWT